MPSLTDDPRLERINAAFETGNERLALALLKELVNEERAEMTWRERLVFDLREQMSNMKVRVEFWVIFPAQTVLRDKRHDLLTRWTMVPVFLVWRFWQYLREKGR